MFDLESHGVAVVGQVPSGLPMPGLPDVTFEDVKMLLLAGLGITIVGYSDIMLIARGFPLAPAEGETAADLRPDPQAELVAMAGVQAMVGIFSGYPVSASGSRTALAIAGGARSQIYSLVAALCIVAVLFFAGPLMSPLPWAALGAVVLYAAGKLVSIPEFRRLWRFRRREFMLAVITLIGTVVIGILQGVVLAIALSLLEMLYRLARPHEGVLGRVPGVDGMHDVADYPDARTIPGCMFYRYDAPLFFANIGDLRERVDKLLDIENEAYPDDPGPVVRAQRRGQRRDRHHRGRWPARAGPGARRSRHPPGPGSREERRVRAAGPSRSHRRHRQRDALRHAAGRRGELPALGPGSRTGAPTKRPEQAIEDEPAASMLPWQRPDADDKPPKSRPRPQPLTPPFNG